VRARPEGTAPNATSGYIERAAPVPILLQTPEKRRRVRVVVACVGA